VETCKIPILQFVALPRKAIQLTWHRVQAILREISEETSYQAAR